MRSSILKKILSETPAEVSERVRLLAERRVRDHAYGVKLIKVIEGCRTLVQLVNAKQYLELFKRMHFAKPEYTGDEWFVFTTRAAEAVYKRKYDQYAGF